MRTLASVSLITVACSCTPAEPLTSVDDDNGRPARGAQRETESEEDDDAAVVALTDLGGTPDHLQCVTGDIHPGAPANVVRLQLHREGDAFVVSMQTGPMFGSHDGQVDAVAAETDLRRLIETPGNRGPVFEQAEPSASGGQLQIELQREGAVFSGRIVDDHCYWMLEAPVTCWSETELFGSSWVGTRGALAARFDWSTGSCLDEDGNPALNRLPIEVVREVRFAECVDLRGAMLNAPDFGHPDLDGWHLVGARLDGATLSSAQLRFASLQGARFSSLRLESATLDGSIDDTSSIPAANCEVGESPWAGRSVSC